jgi:prepilin-type N-terminal cleavage/methylation domain-containing protein/prepilin-type processing-associated H-X9-DG protein
MKRAFSLIELLVVMSIIAILAMLLLPSVGVVRDAARMTTCAGRLRQLGVVVLTYAQEHRGSLAPSQATTGIPAAWGSGIVPYFNWPFLGQYLVETEELRGTAIPNGESTIFHCPADPRRYWHINVSYGLNLRFSPEVVASSWATPNLASIQRRSASVLAADAAHWRWHPGYGVVPANPGVQASAIINGTAPWGAFGDPDCLFCWTAWHRRNVNMAFADGHVRASINPAGESLAGTALFAP